MPEYVEPKTVLQEAEAIINGERQGDYGPPAISLGRISMVWSAILGSSITPAQVALCMAGLKLVREANRHKRDNLIDAAGYIALVERVGGEEAEGKSARS